MTTGKVILEKKEYDMMKSRTLELEDKLEKAESTIGKVRIDIFFPGTMMKGGTVTVDGPHGYKQVVDAVSEYVNDIYEVSKKAENERDRLGNEILSMKKTFSEFKESFRKMSTFMEE